MGCANRLPPRSCVSRSSPQPRQNLPDTHTSGTAVSIAKIFITIKFLRSQEMMWDAIDLSICSINEVCVGIITANLPPLRKTILGVFSKILPTSFATSMGVASRKHGSRFHPTVSQYTSKRHTNLDNNGDDESERYILELEEKKTYGITKTWQFSVREGDVQSYRTASLRDGM
jgi:hypothetical protein